MNSYYRYFSAFFIGVTLLFLSQISYGQAVADTLQLEEIEVVATRIHQPLQLQPTSVQIIDSSRLALQSGQNIGEVLNNSSTLFIKDNGPGGLATASQRGLSAEQTQVLWEGFSINSVMLGLSDLSLLPSSFFSSVQVSSGNPSSAFGGGSLSGAIYLASHAGQQDKVSFRQRMGSYGQWQTALEGQYQSGHWQAGVHSMVSRAENDFEYYNRAYDRYQHRQHNRQEQENVMANIGYQCGVKHFASKVWISNSANEIPGSILKSNSRARQDDKALRWVSTYRTRWHKTNIILKNYLSRIGLNYFDPENATHSLSTFRRWVTSAAFNYAVSHQFLVKGELRGGLSGVETNNYAGFKTRQQVSALFNPELSFFARRLRIYPALRFDSYNDFGNVISPSLGVNYQLMYNKLYLRGELSRNFNPPTYNALYFQPNNDPALAAERSNNAEAGVVFNPRKVTFSTLKLTGFYGRVNNGIRYFQNDSGIFRPENVEQITSKGLEASLKNQLSLPGQWHLQLKQAARFADAEITEPRFAGDAAPGHQLRYVPKWNYQASLNVQKGIVTGLLQYRWTSRRYYTATEDYDSSLDPYALVNATLQLQKQFLGLNFTARGGVRNLLNTKYEIIQYYALPQRNYHLSLTATYQF